MRIFYRLIFIFCIGCFATSCGNEASISEQNVARIIQNLSSDSLKGRHALSPKIAEAAGLIASEFETIGLSPLPGNDTYHQYFEIYTITPDSIAATINGKPLADNYLFGILDTTSINWSTGDAEPKYITEKENFRKQFKHLRNDSISSLIVVSPHHKNWFHRYRAWYQGRNHNLEINTAPNDVVILKDGGVQSMDIMLKNNIDTTRLFNVGGMIEGHRSDEIILFTAHYDHLGVTTPVGQDSIANGANDNASGVAAVAELARYYQQQAKPERTLYFVAFTGEEIGGFGSRYFVQTVHPDEIIAMLNIEMIGKPDLEDPNSAWITGFEHSTLGEILQESSTDSVFTFKPDPYPKQMLFYRSDNIYFARKGIPAHTISTTPIDVDRDYHRVTDEPSTLDFAHTTHTIRAIATATASLVSGDKTPNRINPELLD